MECKFCGALLGEEELCPVCGKAQTEAEQPNEEVTETPETEIPAEEVPETEAQQIPEAEETEAELTAGEMPEELPEPGEESGMVAPKSKKTWPVVLVAVGAALGLVLLAGVLVYVILTALGVEIKIPENDIFRKESYTVQDEDAVEDADTVVATIGKAKLTNAQLQIYYTMGINDFLSYYQSYLGDLGLDFTQPLSDQACYFEQDKSWEQFFLESAINTWQSYQTLCLEAEENGFTMDEELAAELDKMPATLEEQATSGEYESVEAMIHEVLGVNCTMEDYMDYVRTNALANEYYATQYETFQPSEEEVEAYFTANEETLAQSGITKDSGLVSSVRHILVCPVAEEETTEEDTENATDETEDATEPSTEATEPTEETTEETTEATEPAEETINGFTQAQWDECLARAEAILQEWKDGEATEESFAALVATYTEDPGSASTGGLYEGITPTSSYVENFLKWSVDMSRQPGDTGIVQTEYGYHIMYFVSGEPYWLQSVESQMISERSDKFISDMLDSWSIKVNYKKIALADLNIG